MTADEPRPVNQVGIGTQVVIEMHAVDGGCEQMTCQIVHDKAADYDAGYVGANTPLAKALLGKFVGATVPYAVGDIESIYIIEISRPTEQILPNSSSRREAVYDEALRKAERTNAEMFASSYGSKWGSYNLDDER